MANPVQLPLDDNAAEDLRAGDSVELTGSMITGRDQACRRLFELIEAGESLPVELDGQIMYFVGPTPALDDTAIGSAGPTTSSRMNRFLPTLIGNGLRGFIGKGFVSDEVRAALVARRGIYFGAVGGTGALLSAAIKRVEVIAFEDLLTEAVRRIEVVEFPAVVLADTRGGDLYTDAPAQHRARTT